MNEDRATRYQRLKRRGRVAAGVSAMTALAVAAVSPGPRAVLDAGRTIASGLPSWAAELIALALFAAALSIWCLAAAFPARLYLARRVEAQYGAGPSISIEGAVLRLLQAAALAVPVLVGTALVLRLCGWAAGTWWWLPAGALVVAGAVVALHAAPRVLGWSAGAGPIDRPALVDRLTGLAARAGVPIGEVCAIPPRDGGPTAAFVTGSGASRRVFISTDLLRDWSDDEIAVVVAHELGHQATDDLRQSLVLDGVIVTSGLGVAAVALSLVSPGAGGPGDPAALPLIVLVTAVVWVAATPLRHALSRRQERRADAFALALTGQVAAFDAAIRRLGARHLAEARPGLWTRWLFHRHPTVAERRALAVAAARPPRTRA